MGENRGFDGSIHSDEKGGPFPLLLKLSGGEVLVFVYSMKTARILKGILNVYLLGTRSLCTEAVINRKYCFFISSQVVGCDFLISATGVCSCNDFLNSAEHHGMHAYMRVPFNKTKMSEESCVVVL